VRVTNEKIENRQAFLTIEMEPAEVEEALEEAYHRLVKKTDVPGFRRGKAPRAMLERYLGRESLFEDALSSLIPKAYDNAIKEQEIEAFARPSIEIAQTEPLVFKAVVPLLPKVELGDYHHIEVTPEPVELTEDDISAVIERMRHQQAAWEPVERPVGFNDLVVLDIESNVEDKPFINRKGVQYHVLENQTSPLTGFAEQLLGMGRDEVKGFRLPVPPDYPKSELAGKEASFKVRVTEIKQERLPELNDEFARGIDPNLTTLEAFRDQITADLRRRAEEKERLDFEDKVIDAVIKLAQVEYPPFLVEMETDRLLDQQLRHWQGSSRGLEEYLTNINKTEEELREELRPLATKRVIWSLVSEKVAQEENIKVDSSEIDAEIEDMVKGTAEDKRDKFSSFLNTPQSRESIEQLLVRRKTIQRLVEIARGASTDITQEEKND